MLVFRHGFKVLGDGKHVTYFTGWRGAAYDSAYRLYIAPIVQD